MISIRKANIKDVPLILELIDELAVYEKLQHENEATKEKLEATLFGDSPEAEVLIGEYNSVPVSYALFFHNYSTWKAKKGLYLEDLYVKKDMRGKGVGKALIIIYFHILCANCIVE